MAVKDVGIIVNGATGRIASTQHLANALAPIRAEGGLAAGADRIMPRLLLVGRNAERLADIARQIRRRGLDDRSRCGPGAAGLHGVLRRGGDHAAGIGAEQGDRGGQAYLQRKAGGAVGGRGACLAARRARARAQAWRRRGQDIPARIAEAECARRAGIFRARDRLPARFRLVGIRRRPSARASGRAGITGAAAAAGSPWTCTRTGVTSSRASSDRSAASPRRPRPRWRSAWTRRASRSASTSTTPRSRLAELASGAVGTIACSWATRVRRDDLLTMQIDGTGGSAIAGLHRCWAQSAAETPTVRHFNPTVDIGADYRADWKEVPGAGNYTNPYRVGWEQFPAPRGGGCAVDQRPCRRHPRRATGGSLLPQRRRAQVDRAR